MSETPKGRIRHVALSVADPWETAAFYQDALGLEEVTELDGPLAEGVLLTDGEVNLAIRQMDDVTQHNAALVEQVAASASSLDEQTEMLRRAVAAFKVEMPVAQLITATVNP